MTSSLEWTTARLPGATSFLYPAATQKRWQRRPDGDFVTPGRIWSRSGSRHSLIDDNIESEAFVVRGDRIGAICKPDRHLAAKVATGDDAEIPERLPRPRRCRTY
jgi:hypothetical protein